MQWSAPSARARSSFASLDDVMIARAPVILRELQREDRHAARAEREHRLAGPQAPRAVHQRVPNGDAGARQRRGLLERQVLGQPQQAVGREHGVLGQRAVERVTERRRRVALRERRDDAIAAANCVTPAPTAATSPAPSESGIVSCVSGPRKYLPATIARSRKFSDAARMRTSTCPGPARRPLALAALEARRIP